MNGRRIAHIVSSLVAVTCVVSFWTASLVAELSLAPAGVAAVKTGILAGLFVLVPALLVAGQTGTALRRNRTKRRRLRRIRLVAATVLVPCALLLWWWAREGDLSPAFHVVQALELLAGAHNLVLLALNARDGIRSARRWRPSPRRGPATHTATGQALPQD